MTTTNDNLGTSYAVVAPATINVKSAPYSATGDGQVVTDGAITVSTATLVSATAPFTPSDVNKVILVAAAGAGAIELSTTISAFVSATTVTLATNALTTASSSRVRWGTDDTTAVQAAFTAAKITGGKIFVPRGRYFVSTIDCSRANTTSLNSLIIEGEGIEESIFQHSGTNVCVYLGGTNYTTWRDLSLDSNRNSQVGFLLCRLSTLQNCHHNNFVNVGTYVNSTWSKALYVGINVEENTLDRVSFWNVGSTTGTVYFTEQNTRIAVTLPNSDTIGTGTSALCNRITNSTIVTANAGAACVTVEYGSFVVIDGRTTLEGVTTATAVGVRVAGESTALSYTPTILNGVLVEMNGGSCFEAKSYSGTNTIAGLSVQNSFISQSTQIIQYSGTCAINNFVYGGNAELQNPTSLTLTGTFNAPRIDMLGTNSSVVLSASVAIAGADIFARTITDSGAVLAGRNSFRNLTTAGETVASMTANRPQSFVVEITNTAGTIQHRIAAGGGAFPAGVFSDRVSGASTTLANSPALAAGVGFTSGGGVLAAATHIFIFDTAEQVSEANTDGLAVLETNDSTVAAIAKYVVRSDNINGVTRFRPSVQFTNPTTNAVFPLTAANIGAGLKVRVHVRAGIT